jgi:uncharacterized protein (DUF427 family)
MKQKARTEAAVGRETSFRARWRRQVIAKSDRTVEVAGYRYFPRETVRMELLHKVPKSRSDRECPHGVQFYDVGEGASRSARAAWSYEAPGQAMKKVDHWIGSWEDVEVSAPRGRRVQERR